MPVQDIDFRLDAINSGHKVKINKLHTSGKLMHKLLDMGFIIGSLGVVWPWKETIYKTSENGLLILDSRGEKIIENYTRFIPKMQSETYIAIVYILLGILLVLALEWYGKKTRKING